MFSSLSSSSFLRLSQANPSPPDGQPTPNSTPISTLRHGVSSCTNFSATSNQMFYVIFKAQLQDNNKHITTSRSTHSHLQRPNFLNRDNSPFHRLGGARTTIHVVFRCTVHLELSRVLRLPILRLSNYLSFPEYVIHIANKKMDNIWIVPQREKRFDDIFSKKTIVPKYVHKTYGECPSILDSFICLIVHNIKIVRLSVHNFNKVHGQSFLGKPHYLNPTIHHS